MTTTLVLVVYLVRNIDQQNRGYNGLHFGQYNLVLLDDLTHYYKYIKAQIFHNQLIDRYSPTSITNFSSRFDYIDRKAKQQSAFWEYDSRLDPNYITLMNIINELYAKDKDLTLDNLINVVAVHEVDHNANAKYFGYT